MTDEQLETLAKNIRSINRQAGVLEDIQDYLDQVALMANIVTYYKIEQPGSNELQVRMIARIASQGSKVLREALDKIESAVSGSDRVIWHIEMEKLREQNTETTQCKHCANLLQVTEDRVTN